MDLQSLKRKNCCESHNSEDNKHVKRQKTTLQSLPNDLLVEVFGRVASSSLIDVFNTKLCCKDFVKAVEDDHIYQCISMDTIPIVAGWYPLRDEVLAFKAKCLKEGNPEAMFRQGMLDFFGRIKFESFSSYDKMLAQRLESGLRLLKTAANNGHDVAKYVYGLIMLSQGDEEAFAILASLKFSTEDLYSTLEQCRKKMQLFLSCIWIRTWFFNKVVKFQCCQIHHAVRVRRKGFEEFVEFQDCDACMFQYEQVKFFKFLKINVD